MRLRTKTGLCTTPAPEPQQLWNWDAASRTFGVFAEDTWQASNKLTLTLGLRYDDSGNPWSKSAATVFGNFYLGTGTTRGSSRLPTDMLRPTPNALLHSVDNLWSPRVGFAWDPTGKGDWAVRGGVGIYHNWLTSANVQEEFRGSPPGFVESDLLRGNVDSSHLRAGHDKQASVRVYVPDIPRRPEFARRRASAATSRSAESTRF